MTCFVTLNRGYISYIPKIPTNIRQPAGSDMSELLSAIAEKTLKIPPLMLLGTVPTMPQAFVHNRADDKSLV